ncbi:hypothetical protein [Streptomyces sp. NPDC018031]|uniref:hypothetical protein n=1 Tax=Streptomyces sp. NPDC018031 TaxID=3365033 RepID=UPI00378AD3F5
MKYEDVIHAPLGQLKNSVDAWGKLATKLETLATEARDGMQTKADRADWKGLNSTVTRDFIRQTVKEFADAAKAAKGMHALLSDAHTAFKQAKDELVRIRDTDGPEAGIRVDGHGKVSRVDPLENDEGAKHDPDFNAAVKKEKDAADAWQRRIDRIVDNCGDADESFKLALEANTKDAHDFTAPTYSSLDQEEAHRASELLAKGAAISNTQLAQLDELLLDNNHRPTFAKAFYGNLDPEKVLTLYGQLATESSQYGHYDEKKKFLKGVQDLQRGLGLNLATASQDAKFAAEWGPALRKIGSERIALASDGTNSPYGYQVFGGILRHGNYSAQFLTPIAEHVTQLGADDPSMFDPGDQGATYKDAFNPGGKNGAGYDPMISVLEALGNSPAAAKDYFYGDPVLYNRDGSGVERGGTSDLENEFGEGVSYLKYLASEGYESFPDTDRSDPGRVEKSDTYMPEALGHALESATLGRPWDSSEPVVRDEKTAVIAEQVIDVYSDAETLKRHEALSDSLGRMSSAYIDDINWAIDHHGERSVHAPNPTDVHKHLRADTDVVRDFLSALGQHPNAYAAVSSAEQLHTMSHLDNAFDVSSDQDKSDVRNAVRVGAEVQGILDASRAEQIKAEGAKELEEYTKSEGDEAAWDEFRVSAGITAAAGGLIMTGNPVASGAALMVPIAGEFGQDLVSQYLGMSIGEASENDIKEKGEEIDEMISRESERVYRGGERRTVLPVEEFIARHDIDGTFKEDLVQARVVGYGKGNDVAEQHGNQPQTG